MTVDATQWRATRYNFRTGQMVSTDMEVVGNPTTVWDYEGYSSMDLTVKVDNLDDLSDEFEPFKYGISLHVDKGLLGTTPDHVGVITKSQIDIETGTVRLGIGSVLDYLDNVYIYPYAPVSDSEAAFVIPQGTTEVEAARRIIMFPWNEGASSNSSDPAAPDGITVSALSNSSAHVLTEDFHVYYSDGMSVKSALEELKGIYQGIEVREVLTGGFTTSPGNITLEVYNRFGDNRTHLPTLDLSAANNDLYLSYTIDEEPYTVSRVIAVSRDSDSEENISSDLQHRVKTGETLLFDTFESLTDEATTSEMNAVLSSRLDREKYNASIYEISIHGRGTETLGSLISKAYTLEDYKGAIINGTGIPRLDGLSKARIIGITHELGTDKYDLEVITDWSVLVYPQPTRKEKKEEAEKRKKKNQQKGQKPRKGNTPDWGSYEPPGGKWGQDLTPSFPDYPDPDPDPTPDPGGGGGGGKLPNPDGTPALPDANDEYDDMMDYDPTMKWGITDAKTWTLPLSTGGEGWEMTKEEGVNNFYILSGSSSRGYVHNYDNNGTKRILPSEWNERTWNITKMIFNEETGTSMSHANMTNFSIPHTLIDELFVQGVDYDFHPLRDIRRVSYAVGKPFATGGYLYLTVGLEIRAALPTRWGSSWKSIISIKHVRFPLGIGDSLPPVPEAVDLGIFGSYEPEVGAVRAPEGGALVLGQGFVLGRDQRGYRMISRTVGGYHFVPLDPWSFAGDGDPLGHMCPVRPGNRSYATIELPTGDRLDSLVSSATRSSVAFGLNPRGEKSFIVPLRNQGTTSITHVVSARAGDNKPSQEGEWRLDTRIQRLITNGVDVFKGNVILYDITTGDSMMVSKSPPSVIPNSAGIGSAHFWHGSYETDKWLVGVGLRTGLKSIKIERYEVGGLYPNDGGFSEDDLFAYYQNGFVSVKTPQAIPGLFADRNIVRMYQNDENGEMESWLSTDTWEPRKAYEIDLLRNGFAEGKETFIEWETYASNDKFNKDENGEDAPAYKVSITITPETGGTSGTPTVVDNYRDGDGW